MSAALSLKTLNNKASYIRLNQADKWKNLKDVKTERFLSEIIQADLIRDVWELHVSKMREYNFDRLVYGFTHFSTDDGLGDPNDFTFLTNHSTDYINGFINDGLFKDAPMTNWAQANNGACSWTHIAKRMQSATLSPGELATIAFNQKHDVKAGYTISFKAPSLRSKGAIGLTAPKDMSQKEVDENWKEFGDEILLINNVVHLKIIALPLETPAALNLTKRQIQVLQWVSDGKTLQDVSILLNISPATVEKHLRLARQGLGVETTAQAIMKTVRQNQIHITKRS